MGLGKWDSCSDALTLASDGALLAVVGCTTCRMECLFVSSVDIDSLLREIYLVNLAACLVLTSSQLVRGVTFSCRHKSTSLQHRAHVMRGKFFYCHHFSFIHYNNNSTMALPRV
jgi:hypothetical protein